MRKIRLLTLLTVLCLSLGLVFIVVAAARSNEGVPPNRAPLNPGFSPGGSQPVFPPNSPFLSSNRQTRAASPAPAAAVHRPDDRPVRPLIPPPYRQEADRAARLHGVAAIPGGPYLVDPGDWDGLRVAFPRVLWDGAQYRMFYDGRGLGNPGFGWLAGTATSPDGLNWTKFAGNPIVYPGDPDEWDSQFRGQASFLLEGSVYKMWYSGTGGGPWQTGYATSTDLVTWSFSANPVLTPGGPGAWDEGEADAAYVINDGGTYKMWYHGCSGDYSTCGIGYAVSPDGVIWLKYSSNPVLAAGDPGEWDEGFALWPSVVRVSPTSYKMWYRNNSGQLGLATSSDGVNWTKYGDNPLLTQGWDGASIIGHDVLLEGATYKMWLSSGYGLSQGIGYATSADGVSWTMHPDNPVLPRGNPGLFLQVNYAHDWAEIFTAPGEVVTITVDKGGELFTMVGEADPLYGWLGTWEHTWGPYPPNISPGDLVYAEVNGAATSVAPVGEIAGTLDLDANTVSGELHAPWFAPASLVVHCEVWVENGPEGVTIPAVPADGGAFTCDFSTSGWDLQPRQDVALYYVEPDGDKVINVISSPWARVNYRDNWAGVNYPAGHDFTITVKGSAGQVKATAAGTTYDGGGWGGDGYETRWEDWEPFQPDIQVGDTVQFQSDDGYNNTVKVGEIGGSLDVAANSVSGPVYASWFTGMLDVECHPWGAPGPVPGKNSTAAADGSVPYTCHWDPITEWDILPGQDVGVMYIEPDGDRVITGFREPAPYLNIWTWGQGNPGESSNFSLRVDYQNSGQAVAADVVISAVLNSGLVYLGDTSGLPHTGSGTPGDPLVWQAGDLDPMIYSEGFEIFVEVNASTGETVSNFVQIATSTVYGGQNQWDSESYWERQVLANDTQLEVGKWAWTWEPLAGSDFVYGVNTCNQGSTGSTELTLTENLPLSTTLVTWWSQYGGWQEQSRGPHTLVLSRPTVPGWGCADVYVKAHVNPAADPGTTLGNTAVITAANDLTPDDNTTYFEHYVAYNPHPNLTVWKGWPASGQFVPGGEVIYDLSYGATGNVPVDGVQVTFTLPEHTTFVRAWIGTPYKAVAFDPTQITPQALVWDLGTLPDGFSQGFQVLLRIDDDAPPGLYLNPALSITRLPWEDRYDDNKVDWNDRVNDYGPNLHVDKQTYSWQWEGQIWWNLRILNNGTTRLENILITDTLPAGTTLGTWWQDHGPPVSATVLPGGHQVVFTVSELNPGDTASLGIVADLDESLTGVRGLTFTNQVDAPLAGDVDPLNNTDTLTAYTGADVFVRKWHSGGIPEPGEIITFTVEFGNRNTWPWDTNIMMGSHLTETLPEGMTFLYATAPWTPGVLWHPDETVGNQLVWGWGTMWNNATWTFDIVVQIDDDANLPGQTLVNRVEAFGDDPAEIEIDYANNVFDLPFQVQGTRRLFMPVVARQR